MPSYGSLQQAVKVRPGRGEKEKREGEKKKTLFGFIELFLLQVEKHFAPYLGNETVCYSQSVLKSVFASITHASAPQSWSSVSLLAKLHSNKQIFNVETILLHCKHVLIHGRNNNARKLNIRRDQQPHNPLLTL